MKSTLSRFCKIALYEGVSYLVLLLVAMPLKYLADWPLGVKYIGWIHGILFISYVLYLLKCWMTYKWNFKRVVIFFFALLLQFALFLVEMQLQMDINN